MADPRIEPSTRALRDLFNEAAETGASVHLIYYPTRQEATDPDAADPFEKQLLRSVAEEAGVSWFDYADVLPTDPDLRRAAYRDKIHPNVTGQTYLHRAMLKVLAKDPDLDLPEPRG
jgi:lysophospholipase L1-like esterase